MKKLAVIAAALSLLLVTPVRNCAKLLDSDVTSDSDIRYDSPADTASDPAYDTPAPASVPEAVVPAIEERSFTVFFNEGNRTYTRDVSSLRHIIELDYPETVPEGYRFVGWAESKSGPAVLEAGDTLDVTDDLCLYAVFEAETYVISFDANGGSGSAADVEADFGSSIRLPESSFTRSGHEFAGYMLPDGSTAKPGSYVDVTGNMVLKAVWNLKTHWSGTYADPMSINGNDLGTKYVYRTLSPLSNVFDIDALTRQGYSCRITLHFDVSGGGRVKRTVIVASGNMSNDFQTVILKTDLGEKFTGSTALDTGWFPASSITNNAIYIAVAADRTNPFDFTNNKWSLSNLTVTIDFAK